MGFPTDECRIQGRPTRNPAARVALGHRICLEMNDHRFIAHDAA
jgi:hypothetical protein